MLKRIIAFTLLSVALIAAEPEKLTKLRSSYEVAMKKATAPIQKTYTTELEKLKVEFTKAGNLEGALAVDAELKAVAPKKTVQDATDQQPSTKRQIEKDIIKGKWEFSAKIDSGSPTIHGDITFDRDGTAVASWSPNAKAKWEITKSGTLRYPVGSLWECEYTRIDANTFEGIGTGKDAAAQSGKVRLSGKP